MKRYIYMLITAIVIVLAVHLLFYDSKRAGNDKIMEIYRYIEPDFSETMPYISPDYGYVPAPHVTKEPKIQAMDMAVNIGMTIFASLYGNDVLEKQKPLKVSLVNDEIWTLEGNLSVNKDFYMAIQKSDCRILHVSGYKYIDYITNGAMKRYRRQKIDKERGYVFVENRKQTDIGFKRLPLDESVIEKMEHHYFTKSNYRDWVIDNGYTPDSTVTCLSDGVLKEPEIAARISIIILSAIYGDEQIRKEYPFNVSLYDDNVWKLYGSLPKGVHGGTAIIYIQKKDSRIIDYWHEK